MPEISSDIYVLLSTVVAFIDVKRVKCCLHLNKCVTLNKWPPSPKNLQPIKFIYTKTTMKNYSILLHMPETWREPIKIHAANASVSVSTLVKQVLKDALNLPEDLLSNAKIKPRVQKKASAPTSNECHVQCAVSRKTREFLEFLSQSKEVSMKTVASTILFKVCKNMPSKPMHKRLEAGKSRPPIATEVAKELGVDAQTVFNLRFKVPLDWIDVLDANAELNGLTRFKYIGDIFEAVCVAQTRAKSSEAVIGV